MTRAIHRTWVAGTSSATDAGTMRMAAHSSLGAGGLIPLSRAGRAQRTGRDGTKAPEPPTTQFLSSFLPVAAPKVGPAPKHLSRLPRRSARQERGDREERGEAGRREWEDERRGVLARLWQEIGGADVEKDAGEECQQPSQRRFWQMDHRGGSGPGYRSHHIQQQKHRAPSRRVAVG